MNEARASSKGLRPHEPQPRRAARGAASREFGDTARLSDFRADRDGPTFFAGTQKRPVTVVATSAGRRERTEQSAAVLKRSPRMKGHPMGSLSNTTTLATDADRHVGKSATIDFYRGVEFGGGLFWGVGRNDAGEETLRRAVFVEEDETSLNRLRSAGNGTIAARSSVKYRATLPADCRELLLSGVLTVVPTLSRPASSADPDLWREMTSLVDRIAALGGYQRLAAWRLGSLASGRAAGRNRFMIRNPQVRIASGGYSAMFDTLKVPFDERSDRETLIAAAIEGGSENVDGLIQSLAGGMRELAVEVDFVFSGGMPGGGCAMTSMEPMLVEGGNGGSGSVSVNMPTHAVINDGEKTSRHAGMRLTSRTVFGPPISEATSGRGAHGRFGAGGDGAYVHDVARIRDAIAAGRLDDDALHLLDDLSRGGRFARVRGGLTPRRS